MSNPFDEEDKPISPDKEVQYADRQEISAHSPVEDTNAETLNPPAIPASSPPSHGTQVWKGIGLLALLHLLLIVFPMAYFAIGVVQLIYLIPALILARKHTGIVQGLWIGAGITLLLNAACFGIVFASIR